MTRGRTGLVFYSDAEYFGGAEGYLTLLARNLDPEEFRLSAILPHVAGAEPLEERMRAAGAAIHHLERPGFDWLRRLPAMVRVLRAAGGDVLHLNLPSSYDAGVSSVAWAARQAGYRRVVSTEHLPMVERLYRKFPAKLFFTHWIDRVIIVAAANRTCLTRRHGIDPEKVCVIPNGVEEPRPLSPEERRALRSDWGTAPGEAVVGIVGRLTRRKGHHLLLEALSRVRALGPEERFRLIVAGEGEETEPLRERAESLGLSDRVVWLGHRQDAPRLMGAFDLFVLPSTVEAMPLTILEAMAAGVPVIATAVYGVPEVVIPETTGLLVAPGDGEALALAVRRLLMDADLRAAMGRRGRARYEERFTAERMARETAALYRDEGHAAGADAA